MSKEELRAWLDRWELLDAQGAKVLCVQKSKMSEYLSGARTIPDYIAAHVETFDELSAAKAKKVIDKRLA